MTANGKLTLDELRERVAADTVDTVIAGFTDLYGRLMGKRFAAEFFLDHVATDGTHGCDYLLTVDMEMEPIPGYDFANWEKGYGDFALAPDLASLRMADWLDKTALVLCDVVEEGSGNLVPIAPRSLLKQQVERATAMGFTAKAASELEYYLFERSYSEAREQEYTDLGPTSWYLEDYHILQGTREESFQAAVRRHLGRSGVPVESTKGEWGTGQHELNVRYQDIIAMADNHTVYKQCLKEVADRQQKSVTFMAKYDEAQAGSSCHLHLSLWNNQGNAFAGSEDVEGIEASNTFREFLGGWIHHASECMPFYASTVNSYKRFQSGSWAPTRLAWSHDNRTAGFRVVGHGPSLRIECRIPGADCNPYLAFAASLASGLEGVASQYSAPPIFAGDMYQTTDLPQVPATLEESSNQFFNSEFCRKTFGSTVVDHYTHFFRTECEAYQRAVTDWERRRYFERI